MKSGYGLILSALCITAASISDAAIQATIDCAHPGHEVPKTLYSLFFEDINQVADGGLYAERIKNRGFDFPTENLECWAKDFRGGGMARITRQTGRPVHPATGTHLRMEAFGAGDGVGVRNDGFDGIVVEAGQKYDLSFYARGLDGYKGGVKALLENEDGSLLASFVVKNGEMSVAAASPVAGVENLPEWRQFKTVLTPAKSATNAHLSLLMDAAGTVELEQVSLMPEDTWKGHGLRKDLVQWIADLKPGVLRFPGGCILEGNSFENWYDWKLSVGDGTPESRPVAWNLWGYWQTRALGYYEFFQLCEDIGCEPMPIMLAGLTCQFRDPEFAPLSSLDYFAQSIFDLVEFANGGASTKWGALRAKMGHPAPFNMKYLGIGNENWGKEFLDRYLIIQKAVKAKYPALQICSSMGAGPDGKVFDLARKTLNTSNCDLVDEHYYVQPEWLLNAAHRYDNYDRKWPKVFVGEYAGRRNNLCNSHYTAVCEAALLTGFERNSDIVVMSAYAPLYNKVGKRPWTTDLIWFDNTRSFGTPNYWAEKLFAANVPSVALPTATDIKREPLPPSGKIALEVYHTAAEFKDIRVTKGAETLYAFDPARRKEGWTQRERGQWVFRDGALAQIDADAFSRLTIGDSGWTDYTVTLRARRWAGREGFTIRVRDAGSRFIGVNLGGWDNTQHGLVGDHTPDVRKPGHIENGRWYDIKISLSGSRISVWLDGKPLFADVDVPTPSAEPVFMVSGLDKDAGELVVKCVNAVGTPQPMHIALNGATIPAGKFRRVTLAADGDAINTLDAPEHVKPVEDTLDASGSAMDVTLPPFSVVVLRGKIK